MDPNLFELAMKGGIVGVCLVTILRCMKREERSAKRAIAPE